LHGIVLLGLVAGSGTCLGALLIILRGRLQAGRFSFLLGLAAGIMTAVIAFDLVPSSLRYGSPVAALTGFCGGIGMMAVLDCLLNSLSPATFAGKSYLKMGYLIAAGIALHDFPEGMAIAAGFAAAEKLGPLLVFAIGLHNIPEGMAAAAPLGYGGLGAWRILAINAAISAVTPLGAFAGFLLTEKSRALISPLLAFAAGTMTYIVIRELAPESRRNSRLHAYTGMLAGIFFIIALDFIA